MTARSWIKRNIKGATQRKLLNGIDSMLRYQRKINFNEYKMRDLIEDLNNGTISQMRGVGKSTVDKLRQALKDDHKL